MQLLNVRTGDGNRGIIRSPQSAIALPDILGVTIETSASCEARSAPSSYPTQAACPVGRLGDVETAGISAIGQPDAIRAPYTLLAS